MRERIIGFVLISVLTIFAGVSAADFIPAPKLEQISYHLDGFELRWTTQVTGNLEAFEVERERGREPDRTFTLNPFKLRQETVVGKPGVTFVWRDTNGIAPGVLYTYHVHAMAAAFESMPSNALDGYMVPKPPRKIVTILNRTNQNVVAVQK